MVTSRSASLRAIRVLRISRCEPEDKRYEILDEDLYMVATPNIRHQSVSLNLKLALFQ